MSLDNLKSYILGVILSIVIVTGGLMFMTSFLGSNPNLDNANKIDEFNDSMNKADEVQLAVSDMSSSITSASTNNVGILGWLNALIGSAFDGIKAIFKSFSFVNVMANDLSNMLGVPPMLIALLLLIITIIIVFAIWSIATGGR
jgi:hypothetical protein